MSDGLPTDEQLRRMERTVMARIRRRAELPRRIATGAAVAALFAGGVFLVPRLGLSSGGGSASSGAGGSTAQHGESQGGTASGAGSPALLATCHASSSTTGSERRVRVRADTAKAAVDACLAALVKGQVPAAPATGPNDFKAEQLTAKDLVVCRGVGGTLQVFVKDAHPSTLCTRNGLRSP